MAASKLVLLSLFLALVFSHGAAEYEFDEDGEAVTEKPSRRSAGAEFSALKIKLDELKSKILDFESELKNKTQELNKKDQVIAEKEKIIRHMSDSVASLQTELSTLQKKGKLDAQERVGKAHAQAVELEKQVDELKIELEVKQKEKEALEAQANEFEKKLTELNLKLENLQKISDEQKSKIRKTERALKVAEEEMMKAKQEATSKNEALMEAHGAWLPPWLAKQLIHCQAFIETHWKEHGKPAMNIAVKKALEKKAQVKKWAEPHLETVKTKWAPAIKEQWLVVRTQVEPHVQLLTAKTVEFYEASKVAMTPHLVRIQEIVDPYFQEAKKFSKPYIDQIATVAKPHIKNVRLVMKPYTKKVVHAYGEFLKSATTYHGQVQATVREMLKQHELTKPLATKELEWFAASALLALPIIILFRISSAIFCKKAKKPSRHAHSHHARRKGKRGHPDK
ncbi:hypothetical protein SLEP1_g1921 [Rubroshorea leprosula]|uniref:Uncharacterized protein n=1 Tax=Rubroshorea leprosula TaxID=152421 RepID=A0AAV5HNM8_9ROSI|nr:hypothetical protein SLEP1_g1921 [Rubroshorea leprosula]